MTFENSEIKEVDKFSILEESWEWIWPEDVLWAYDGWLVPKEALIELIVGGYGFTPDRRFRMFKFFIIGAAFVIGGVAAI